MNIVERIRLTCESHQIRMGMDIPIKVGPDVYMFMAVKMTDSCRRAGICRYQKYYALTGGREVKLIDESNCIV